MHHIQKTQKKLRNGKLVVSIYRYSDVLSYLLFDIYVLIIPVTKSE